MNHEWQAIVDDSGPDVVRDALTRLNALAKESSDRMLSSGSGDSFQGQTDLEVCTRRLVRLDVCVQ